MTLAVVSHPAKQGNMYRIPAGAARCGFETVFLTGYYWRGRGPTLRLLERVAPETTRRLTSVLERRRLADMDPKVVRRVSGPLPELLYRVADYPLGNWVHDSLAALWLKRNVPVGSRGVFHGFQDSSAISLAAATGCGLATAVEMTLPPSASRLVAAERTRLGLDPGVAEPPQALLDTLGRAQYVIAQSRFSALSAIEHGVAPGRIFQMPLGVDAERFRPDFSAPPKTRGLRVLFTGQMSIRKGVHHLLAAWDRLARPEDELIFAGYPSERYVLDLVARSRGRRRYLGFVTHERLHEVYRQADIFVFPSLAEGGVYVIYEALASGLPCIVSENAGSAVRDGIEGFVVPVGDVEALIERMRLLRDDEALRRSMAQAARRRGEHFSWPNFYRRVGLLYGKILARGGAAGDRVADLFEEEAPRLHADVGEALVP